MNRIILLSTAALVALASAPAIANDRYREMPPVVVSPDLSAPWVIQLGRQPGRVVARRPQGYATQVQPMRRVQQPRTQQAERRIRPLWSSPDQVQTAAVPAPRRKQIQPQMDPVYLPQQVDYSGSEKPGTIVIDTAAKFLYLVQGNGQARRYGVGVGKEGMVWTGSEKITRKAEWPDWRPPAEMIARERQKGRDLPTFMAGGPENPLGARAMYLGSTLYRIHGTNAPWTIGTNVSSGCIRLRNEDVVDLFERVPVGTTVKVI
ncbi:MAG: L,D-transpeptidase family protein [Rhizobiaceae bacterium]|nr:L,D-transpeptidase family protein [Rhizobiaceae bacterium]